MKIAAWFNVNGIKVSIPEDLNKETPAPLKPLFLDEATETALKSYKDHYDQWILKLFLNAPTEK